MQRQNSFLLLAVLLVVSTSSPTFAVAGEYTYAMAASESADAPAAADVSNASGVGPNNRLEGMGARYLVSQDEAPAAVVRGADEAEPSTAAQQATLPSGSSGPASDKRATHRWQSLVPGAIK